MQSTEGLGSENYSGMKIPWAERSVPVRLWPGAQQHNYNMTEKEIKEITAEYNEKRRSMPFTTISASWTAVQDLIRLNPGIETLPRDKMVEAIAREIYSLAFL